MIPFQSLSLVCWLVVDLMIILFYSIILLLLCFDDYFYLFDEQLLLLMKLVTVISFLEEALEGVNSNSASAD